jgi:hypothetical protein
LITSRALPAGYKPASIARGVASLRSFFRFLAADGHIGRDPAELLNLLGAGRRCPNGGPDEVDCPAQADPASARAAPQSHAGAAYATAPAAGTGQVKVQT